MRRVLALLALALAAPAVAETIAITGGTVALGDGSAPIAGGTVVIRDGRVSAAGARVPVPAGARVVDATGKWVVPGFVAGFTDLGLVEISGVEPTNDSKADKSPFSAAIDVSTAINPLASPIAISRARGVTRAIVAPASAKSIFAGQGAVISLADGMTPVMRPRAFQYVELGEGGATTAGGSRAAAQLLFRDALAEARDYARDPARYDGRSKDAMLLRLDAAALVPVVEGRMPLMVHVERASDILAALALTREFPALKLVIAGAAEGWTVAARLAAARVPVIVAPLGDLPASFETLAATQSNIGRLTAAGVTAAVGQVGVEDVETPRVTGQLAGNLVALTKVPGATGLDWGHALAAISMKPAEALGLGGEIGSLLPGRRADVVIWDGDPLELESAPVAMWIDGVAQPLGTRQTRLRDRYRDPVPGALPKAYDR